MLKHCIVFNDRNTTFWNKQSIPRHCFVSSKIPAQLVQHGQGSSLTLDRLSSEIFLHFLLFYSSHQRETEMLFEELSRKLSLPSLLPSFSSVDALRVVSREIVASEWRRALRSSWPGDDKVFGYSSIKTYCFVHSWASGNSISFWFEGLP